MEYVEKQNIRACKGALNKNWRFPMPKKKDFILIGVLLVIALVGLAVTRLLQHQSGASVTITVCGEVYGTYPLNQSREIEISDDRGYNKVVIENGSVHMEDADCPDQYCVQHAAIHSSHETIICLPHELVVEITGGEVSDVDVITQ